MPTIPNDNTRKPAAPIVASSTPATGTKSVPPAEPNTSATSVGATTTPSAQGDAPTANSNNPAPVKKAKSRKRKTDLLDLLVEIDREHEADASEGNADCDPQAVLTTGGYRLVLVVAATDLNELHNSVLRALIIIGNAPALSRGHELMIRPGLTATMEVVRGIFTLNLHDRQWRREAKPYIASPGENVNRTIPNEH